MTARITPRGPVSAQLLQALSEPARPSSDSMQRTLDAAREALDQQPYVGTDDDLQLALLVSYGLSYGGVVECDDRWEWHPAQVAVRTAIEDLFEQQLRERVEIGELPHPDAESVAAYLFAATAEDSGPSLSRYLAKKATREQATEFIIHRSIYTLKEADPHSWAIPRLTGRAKAALVEVQSDEYGGGQPSRMHSVIFAKTMAGVGLDPSYGAYIDRAPAVTLASFNMMSMFGLNRRLRGAIAGHLAAFEMTSSIPNRLYGNGFRRLGYDSEVTDYFDEHVEADAVHEQIAGRDLAGGLAEEHPELLPDIVFGARACLYADGLVGAHMLERWQAGASSLRAEETVTV
ncbi:iron-containing redox enzyme family protein [Leifsonia sp. NPDC102414]|uniref:iron-containing redox enzyme family protein n=1 Tax=Leifsonia sp. NPDC102414 TaxID=3364124 RepID=UPI00380CCCFA